MSFVEILEIIRDFNSQITISDLLNSNLNLDDFEDMSYDEIFSELAEKFEEE